MNLATTTKDGGPGRAITLRSAADGWSTVSFADGTKQVRLVLGLGYDGEPRLRMSTKDGKARVTLGSDMSGRVDCILHDASGSERVVIRSAPDGSPSIKLYDREEKRVFHAP